MGTESEKGGEEMMRAAGECDLVVGQDKGSASLSRAGHGFRCDSYDFHARQDDAYASLYRKSQASSYLAPISYLEIWLAGVWPVLVGVAASMAALVLLGHVFRLRIMLTDSAAPAGVYHLSAAPIERGALVAACLPVAMARTGLARGYLHEGDCPAGAEPVAKVIGALGGDELQIEPGWVAVNSVKFANSQTATYDSEGRPLVHVLSGARRVAAGEVWLFGFNNPRSWDARYFGPVPAADLRGVLRPLVTW
jgi:conjugative transfer signal peptidase TraF